MGMVASDFGASVVSFEDDTAAPATTQQGGEFPPMPFDMHRYRTVLPKRWTALLRAHFRSAYHVQVFFDVDSKTARDWWHGKTGPAAPFALRAVATIPSALKALMEDAA